MIPASYLFKDTYRQHWGNEFERIEGEKPVAHGRLNASTARSLLAALRDLAALAFEPRRSPCPELETGVGARC